MERRVFINVLLWCKQAVAAAAKSSLPPNNLEFYKTNC